MTLRSFLARLFAVRARGVRPRKTSIDLERERAACAALIAEAETCRLQVAALIDDIQERDRLEQERWDRLSPAEQFCELMG